MLRLLLPIDDSGKIEYAVRYVAMCQSESRSPVQLHLLHVETPFSSYIASKVPAGAIKRYHDDHSRAVLEPAAAALARANIPHKTHTVVGDPVQCIVDYARDTGINRIALVTHATTDHSRGTVRLGHRGRAAAVPGAGGSRTDGARVAAQRLRARRRCGRDDPYAGISRSRVTGTAMTIDNTEFWVALAQIIGINIVLSGDNAVVIALAARSLPPKQQKQAVLWGSGAAVVMRIVLTVVAVELLKLPWLKLVGAVLLFWIAIKLLVPESEGEGGGKAAAAAWPPPSRPSSSPTW